MQRGNRYLFPLPSVFAPSQYQTAAVMASCRACACAKLHAISPHPMNWQSGTSHINEYTKSRFTGPCLRHAQFKDRERRGEFFFFSRKHGFSSICRVNGVNWRHLNPSQGNHDSTLSTMRPVHHPHDFFSWLQTVREPRCFPNRATQFILEALLLPSMLCRTVLQHPMQRSTIQGEDAGIKS